MNLPITVKLAMTLVLRFRLVFRWYRDSMVTPGVNVLRKAKLLNSSRPTRQVMWWFPRLLMKLVSSELISRFRKFVDTKAEPRVMAD